MSNIESTSADLAPSLDKMRQGAEEAARSLRSLSNPSRLLLLCALAEGEKSVSELQDTLGMSQAYASQQLARLRREGLVDTDRHGRSIRYRLSDERVIPVIQLLNELYCP